jgi:hypothetical protein
MKGMFQKKSEQKLGKWLDEKYESVENAKKPHPSSMTH